MFSKLKILLVGVILGGAVLWPTPALAAPPSSASSASDDTHLFDACQGVSKSPVCNEGQSQGTKNPVSGPGGVIQTAANIIALVAGISAVIIIVISAFVYATAGGAVPGQRAGDSPNRAAKARSTLTGAVIGLVIVVLAWAIVSFVVQRVVK